MVLSAHHVQITVPDLVSAREFYCGFLGLKEIPRPEALSGREGLWLDLGGIQVHVSPEDGVDRHRTKAHVAYLVSDLEYWRKRLSARGIEARDGIKIPGYVRFEFRDPFGNRVEFLQAS